MLVRTQPGTIITIAGTGEPGYSGDGGPGTSAQLNEPKSLALDRRGGLYVADSENHCIRRLDLTTGTISTIAGCADGSDAAAGSIASEASRASSTHDWDEDPFGGGPQAVPDMFVQQADLSGTVRFLVGTPASTTRFSGDGGPAAAAGLHFPSAVAVDTDGTLYVADTMNHRIRRIDGHTGIITTIAGMGKHRFSGDGAQAVEAALNEPAALALDGRGGLHIADQSNNRVRRVDLVTGAITTVAGIGESAYDGDGGPATAACLAGPSGLAVGPDGTLYIADTFNGRVRTIDPTTGLIRTVIGDGGEYRYQGVPNEVSMSLSRPYGIALESSGDMLITDSDSHLIRRWRRRRNLIARVAGNGTAGFQGDGGPAEASSLNYPFGVVVDAAGNIYIADTFNHRIRMIAA